MTNIESLVENASVWVKSLTTAAEDFVTRLIEIKEQSLALEEDLASRRNEAQRELDALDAELKLKREEHRQMLASLQSIRKEKEGIKTLIEGCLAKKAA